MHFNSLLFTLSHIYQIANLIASVILHADMQISASPTSVQMAVVMQLRLFHNCLDGTERRTSSALNKFSYNYNT